jgi:hypothetical protein
MKLMEFIWNCRGGAGPSKHKSMKNLHELVFKVICVLQVLYILLPSLAQISMVLLFLVNASDEI